MPDPTAVSSSLDELSEGMAAYEEELADEIAELAKRREWQTIQEKSEYAKQMRVFAAKIIALKEEWDRLNGLDDLAEPASGGDADSLPVTARTRWEKLGDKIRVQTEGGRSAYSNVIPVWLFKELALSALNRIKSDGYVKTSDVLNVKLDTIVEKSEYKRAPRLPVYVTFKVLVKEGLFENPDSNSHRYTLVGGNEQALRSFLDRLD
ncbi:hypothetical protein [Paenibacillus flagellatus]|uniref:Uncharacterized protein n=1 Tax=Paenibacillus flagellatus TaxID=2211139 RepID=A0A2V5JYX6_9BACL|nr:hypothetical protein [Paenibacillus flagellatus]PYI50494.1 hypothetical protein DLM86_28755 [Paenibacillus flagellatus]